MKLLPSLFTPALLWAALSFPAAAATLGSTGACLYLLTTNNELASVCDTAVTQPSPPLAVSGLVANDVLMAIDVRPMNQELYGLARNSVSGALQLYHLSAATGVANAVGQPIALTDAGGNPIPTNASRFGIDFNPITDRLRVVTNTSLNIRLNPTTGALAAIDSAINGLTTTVDGCAYTNNEPGAVVTTLYTLDSASDSLYIQNPPNNGTEVSPIAITLSGTPVNFTAVVGFDLPSGINAAASNTTATGKAYAALTIGGSTGLYRIDLATGAATLLGTPGLSLRSLAVKTQIPYAVALDATATNLVRFRTDTPGTTTTVPVTNVAAGETLVGLDFRPATGQLYGLGVNATADTGTLYLIDPNNAAASAVGGTGFIALTNLNGTVADLPTAGTGYGFDFNPTVDRIRVVTGNGLSFRINPNTGVVVDGDTGNAGTNPDGGLNGGALSATAAAYTNSYAGATTTTLYVLDAASDSLFIQNPPNNGTLTQGLPVTLGGSTLDFTSACNLDILAESGAQVSSNVAAPGTALATLTVGGTTGLFRINLTTGAATALGTIGSGGRLSGFTAAGEMSTGSSPLTWPSATGTSYRIETSTDLKNWQPLPGSVTAVGTSTTTPVPRSQGEPRRFWRAVSL